MLADFHLLRPWWLLALVPIVLLAIAWARRRAGASNWERSVAPELLAVLLEPGGRGGASRLGWLFAAGLALAVLGLAGPTWQRLPQPVEQRNDALVVVLDLSLSMFATDLSPNRMVRVRHKITDLLRARTEGFTALVVYAGDAHTVAPLTDDTATIQNLLAALSPDMMPILGSNPRGAMEAAHQLFANARIDQGLILLVTDGVDRPADITDFADRRYPVAVLGVGTPQGATIPLDFANQPGKVLTSQSGQAVVAALEEDRLETIAHVAHGRYRRLGLDDSDFAALLATPLPRDLGNVEVEREFDTWADAGYWIAIALLPLLLFGFRRGLLAALALAVMPPPAHAGWWDDLWVRRDRQAYQAMIEGDPESAAGLFADPDWRNAAHYRSEDYAAAAEGYQAARNPDEAYNLGNALARLGQYEHAIEAYDRTLAEMPDHADAAFNRDLVQKLLEQQQQAGADDNQEQQDEGGQNPENERESQDGDGQQDQSGDPGAEAQDGSEDQDESDPQPGDQPASSQAEQQQGEEQEVASRDELKDALEQWLRRVPDDPGGLLRRKFQYETNQRLRSGEYRDRQTEQIW
jgi:Ca-activated chloride channel family protein